MVPAFVKSMESGFCRTKASKTPWGTGFQLNAPPWCPMLGPTSFGHDGAGGQLAFADAQSGIGFAYLTNQMGGPDDDRFRRLVAALRNSLKDLDETG
jgi:CubicO group peptidase (beta-lactamase class C family)